MAIGDQRPSRQLIQAPAPRVGQEAFGAGISRGLGNIAQSMSELDASQIQLQAAKKQTEESFKQRQQKLERSGATSSLVRMRAETAREIEELRREWPNPSADGFTNAVNDLVTRKTREFSSGLTDEVRQDFQPRLAEFEETFVTQSFETELKAGDQTYVKAAQDITNTARDEILLGSLTLENAAEEIDLFLDSSPLSQLETDELAQEIFSSLQTAAFSVEAGRTARDPLADRGSLPAPDPSTGIYAAGMSPAAAGFLQSTGGAESGNDYNVMFSPGKRRTFDDFSKHPNSPARIQSGPNKGKVSTAAGRYQIIKETWDRAAKALDLEDFSPANQDRAAWWIAQEAFNDESQGMSIEQALASGDPVQIERVRRVLSGESGSGVVYEGLRRDKGMTPDKFYEQVTSGTATMPSVATDERFDNISLTEKLAIFSDAVTAENQQQNEVLKARQRARDTAFNELVANINLGVAGESDIIAANEQYRFSAVEFEKLNTAYESANAEQIAERRFAARLQSPGFVFDSTAASERDQANTFAKRNFSAVLEQTDEDSFNSAVAPFVAQTGFVPNVVQQRLQQFTQSADPNVAEFGFRSMQTLFETDPNAFDKAFGEKGQAIMRGFVGAQLRGQNIQDYQAEVRARQLQPEFFAQADSALQKARRDNPQKFGSQNVANSIVDRTFSNADFGSLSQVNALRREYDAVVRNAMIYNPDPDEAHKTAIETLKTRWGESELGGGDSYVIRRPIEKQYPTVNGSHKWTERQARADLGIPDEQPIRFISDSQTEAEIAEGRPPSYLVYTDESGTFSPVMRSEEQAPAEPTGRMLPARVAFERRPEIQNFEINRVLLRDELMQLREEEEFIRQRALEQGAGTDEERSRIQELRSLIQEKEEELTTMERRFR